MEYKTEGEFLELFGSQFYTCTDIIKEKSTQIRVMAHVARPPKWSVKFFVVPWFCFYSEGVWRMPIYATDVSGNVIAISPLKQFFNRFQSIRL